MHIFNVNVVQVEKIYKSILNIEHTAVSLITNEVRQKECANERAADDGVTKCAETINWRWSERTEGVLFC